MNARDFVHRGRTLLRDVWSFAISVGSLVVVSAVLYQSVRAAKLEQGYPPTIADPSNWTFKYIYESGAVQDGGFRLEDGELYHIGSPNAVGKASFDAEGLLHLEFFTHRKISNGEAVVRYVKPRHWKGILHLNGQTCTFDMKRR